MKANTKKCLVKGIILACSCFVIGGCSSQDKNSDERKSEEVVVSAEYSEEYREIVAEGLVFKVNKEKKTARVTSYYDLEQEVFRIPDQIEYEKKKYPVTKIAKETFGSNMVIKEVTIGNRVKTIGEDAFYTCPELSKVIFSDHLETIDTYAFGECAFSELELPESLKSVGDYAFTSCEKLKKITIPSNVKSWGAEVFSECKGLEEVSFADGATVVGRGAFTNDEAITKVTLPDSFQNIGAEAFWGCTGIKELQLPDGLSIIGDRAFMYTSIEELKVPESVSEVTADKFEGLTELKKIIVPKASVSMYKDFFNDDVKIETY